MAARRGALTERTAWARNLAAPVRDFLNAETGGAVFLLAATVAALVWANVPGWHTYEDVWTTELAVRVGEHGIALTLREWIDSGLMTFFFLVVGLEAKRELDIGTLRDRRRLGVALTAALGGLALPVLIYLALNAGGPGAKGWGAAMSTDTAFMLGVLALVAPGGTRLRVRLLALAVFDDLVALLVIAVAYTEHLSTTPLLVAVALFGVLLALRFAPATWRGQAAAVLGVAVWVALHESGIDPVIAGLAVGLVTTAYPPPREELEHFSALARAFREQPTPELARSAQRGLAFSVSPNERLQYRLHPWTSYVIVPLFALSNAGIHVDGALLGDAIASPITLGIVAGYLLGKPVGISAGRWVATRIGLEEEARWPVVAASGVVAGIPFTVSLLIAGLAFEGPRLEEAKLGVLAGAILAALLGWAAFRAVRRLPVERRIAVADELADLSEDVDPARDHVRGGADAPVTLLEYGDYECPYCGQAEAVIRELLESFGDELRYVWRHLPLNDVHPNAQIAAEAAEAAAAQGAFWPMHDRLLEEGGERDPGRIAEELGLDLDRFWEDLRRRRHAARIERDVSTADASGVVGTPTFFVNGRRHHGAYDADTLTQAVRAAATRARLSAPVG